MTTIIPRQSWGALRQAQLRPIDFPNGCPLIVHHTAGATAGPRATLAQDTGTVRGVDRYHYYVRGYRGGVGYSYLVTEAGRIFEGRGRAVGAHTLGYNDRPAVALVGDYRSKTPPPAMREAVWALLDAIPEARLLSAHRLFYGTTCPGEAAMRGLVLMGRPPARPAAAPPPEPPYGSTLRLVIDGHAASPWAGWDECSGPLRWIAQQGLEPGAHAIAWRHNVWRGAGAVEGVARNLVRRFL